jgi:hypothetical protein
MKLPTMQFSSPLFDQNIFLSTLFSDTFSLCSSRSEYIFILKNGKSRKGGGSHVTSQQDKPVDLAVNVRVAMKW